MKRGFTLIEVLVSILLLSIVITYFGIGISNILVEDDLIKSESQATILAEKKLEEYRRAIINNWTATFTLSGNFSSEGWTSYRYTITVTDLTSSFRRIKVLVWEDVNNNSFLDPSEGKSILLTMIAKRK
jgi:prepilin-type N-terminal cleavage/methylation domain-containing protein